MKIANKIIDEKSPAFIVAELSGNHNGKIKNAINAIVEAKKTGADAIKLQTYTPDTITLNSKKNFFKIKHGTIWDGTTLYELYKKSYTPWEWHKELFRIAKEEGIICFSSPFDSKAIELLESLNCPAYKIASPEILDTNLIEESALTKKPIIISSGIASKNDIDLAVKTCRNVNNNEIAVLKCTVEYPAPLSKSNLSTIVDINNRYNVISGLSDHTLGYTAPVVAVSLGAKIIEKHFIVSKSIGGPDSSFSLTKNQFSKMVKHIRIAEECIGEVEYKKNNSYDNENNFVGRSLFFVEDMKENEIITNKSIRSIRPGYGIHPKHLKTLIGKKVVNNVERGTPVSWDLINNSEKIK